MSNRYWIMGESGPFCIIDNKLCAYPTGYCSVCPRDNPDDPNRTTVNAEHWNEYGQRRVEANKQT